MASTSSWEDAEEPEGFCHFNEDSSSTEFRISLFGHALALLQSPVLSELGHGACVWDASVVFAKYMERNPGDFGLARLKDATVLELGSGCGLGGIAFMARGADVTMTDLPNVTAQLTSVNASKQYRKFEGMGGMAFVPIRPKVTAIDWTEREANPVLLDAYDIILLTDCVFKKSLACDLVATIRRFAHSKTEVYCCHEIRDEVCATRTSAPPYRVLGRQ